MLRRTFIAAAAASSIANATLAGGHSKDIVDTAIGAGSFGTLVAAVQAAGLVEVLKGEGPFTVFAPTDEAFAALPAGTVETLLVENKDQLVNILTYHVLPGKVMSTDIAGKSLEVKMVNGGTAKIDATDGVQIDAANVISADIEASNGVIHVIDAVILPANKTKDLKKWDWSKT
ncbi:MAG: beta-Ig-H3/fasciclin [Paracoccaceae bacterium]|nr:MAG: beta-Ig-H3/fasciclin [Paracoccaceae bacterium]